MASPLERRVQKQQFADASEEALVGLLVAAGHLRQALDDVCVGYGITHDQYNVLRILRGAHPDGHPRKAIVDRLIERAPDVTRLLDRLVRADLVERYRSEEDRRLSIARITKQGLDLLADMDGKIRSVREQFFEPLSDEERRQLARLCTRAYAGQEQ